MNNVILYGKMFNGKIFCRVRNRKLVWCPTAKFYRKSQTPKIVFQLEEYIRFAWANDPKKFSRNYSTRWLNIRRKKRGWKMLSPLNRREY